MKQHFGNLTIFSICVLLITVVIAVPRGNYVLVIGRPTASAGAMMEVIGNAGGTFVAAGRAPWIAVAYSDELGFATRLLRSGALLVLNHALAIGCAQKDLK